MDHPFQPTISEAELIRRHEESVRAAAEQARQDPPQPQTDH
ncbi:hypothetical protein OOK31_25500 [Streptomyces sp. NBC_00249]|nr:hypothetical protein [Streptomyces sp. NBC_00249]MCX5197213.1 hypothetical protein [Streptomyces sp. NBC_00249]